MNTPHQMLNPSMLPTPSGYTHAVVTGPGRLVFLAGQTGHRTDGSIDEGIVEQFEQAAKNIAIALDAAGGAPEHIASMQIFLTDLAGYRDALGEVGEAYRRVLGPPLPGDLALRGQLALRPIRHGRTGLHRGGAGVSDIDIRPVTADNWDLLDALFAAHGTVRGCWCMYFRLTSREFNDRLGRWQPRGHVPVGVR